MMILSPGVIQHVDLATKPSLSVGTVVLVHIVLRKPGSKAKQLRAKQETPEHPHTGSKEQVVQNEASGTKVDVKHQYNGRNRIVSNMSQGKQYLVLKISFMY